jgi:hypothetical protein
MLHTPEALSFENGEGFDLCTEKPTPRRSNKGTSER